MRLPAERFGVARGVQRGRFHKTLTLAGYGSPKVRHEPFAKLALQFAHQVTNPNSVHAAENALDEIPHLSLVIEVESPDLERFSQLEHAIHPVFVALRSHIAISSRNSPSGLPARSARARSSRNLSGSYSSRREISAAHSRSNTRPSAPILPASSSRDVDATMGSSGRTGSRYIAR